jgi:predicted nucleotidyltransferase
MDLIQSRNKFSNEKLELLRGRILQLSNINKFNNKLCIYATGSFARGEASEHSDIDIFFISKNYETQNLEEIILKSELISLTRELGFQDFSGDGEFLEIHCIKKIKEELGTKYDDYHNYFTARLLLLLESKPLFNDELYEEVISEILEVYFDEYDGHKETFAPIFLTNDIIRFWKTMCLNYQEKKMKRGDETLNKNKSRIKNLKLKFSRMTTCYSILCCLKKGEQTTIENVCDLISMTPIERLLYVKDNDQTTGGIVDQLINLYEWFLEKTGKETSEVHGWIDNRHNKTEAFKKADEFHDNFYQLLEITSKDLLKYYTI